MFNAPGPLVAALGEVCDDALVFFDLEANDTKFARLLQVVREIAEREPDEKLIIFSSFRRTIDYLARRLSAAGVTTIELHGGIKDPRQLTLEQFAAAASGTILLTSEVGGEGLDLSIGVQTGPPIGVE